MPDVVKIAESIDEPWIKATILVPDEYLGNDPEALRGPARRAARADLRRQAGPC